MISRRGRCGALKISRGVEWGAWVTLLAAITAFFGASSPQLARTVRANETRELRGTLGSVGLWQCPPAVGLSPRRERRSAILGGKDGAQLARVEEGILAARSTGGAGRGPAPPGGRGSAAGSATGGARL